MTENLPAALSEQQLALMQEAGATNDFARGDLMIPSLRILQSNSKEIKRSTAEYVEGAKDGSFFINVTRQFFDEAIVIPVKYLHVVREFESGALNARMIKDHGTNLSVLDGLQRDEKGRYMRNDSEAVLTDSALYYILVVLPDSAMPCALRMGSTQWRAARRWNTVLQHFEMKAPDGRLFKPPMYARSYKLTARSETNGENSWFVYHIEPDMLTLQMPGGMDLFQRAKMFREAADEGRTQVDERASAADPADEGETPRTSGGGEAKSKQTIDDEIPF